LCHSQTYFIDEQGNFLQNYDIKLKADALKPHERFHELLTKHLCYQCYGVIRASALRMIPPMGGYGNADGILLLRLGILGRFYEIPEYLFFARSHPQQSMSMYFPNYLLFANNTKKTSLSMLPDFYAYAVWFDSEKKGQILLPHWRIIWEYLLSIWRSPLSFNEQLCCYRSLHQQLKGAEYLLLKDLLRVLQVLWKGRQPAAIGKHQVIH
jgi:hypothetical protein